MRTLDVDGTKFEWIVGSAYIRIKGNGHVKDISLSKFLQEECGVSPAKARVLTGGHPRSLGIEPSDVVAYIRKHGWLTPRSQKKGKTK